MAKGFKGARPGGMGGKAGGGMMQQLQKLQEQMEITQAKLAEETVIATVGGGAIKITMTGDQVCKAVEIDPALVQEGDIEMLQDMLMTAFNQAREKAQNLANDRLGPLTSGLSGLPF